MAALTSGPWRSDGEIIFCTVHQWYFKVSIFSGCEICFIQVHRCTNIRTYAQPCRHALQCVFRKLFVGLAWTTKLGCWNIWLLHAFILPALSKARTFLGVLKKMCCKECTLWTLVAFIAWLHGMVHCWQWPLHGLSCFRVMVSFGLSFVQIGSFSTILPNHNLYFFE